LILSLRRHPRVGKILAVAVALTCAFFLVPQLYPGLAGRLARLSSVFDHRIFIAVSSSYARFALLVAMAYALECFFIGYEKSSLRMLLRWDKQIRYDLVWGFLPWFPIYGTVILIMTFGLSAVDWPWMPYLRNSFPVAAIWFFPLQLVVLELALSFIQYWQHRAMHTVPIFWETHKFHHSAEQMTTLSLQRETPFTAFVNAALTNVPAAVIGTYIFPAEPTTIDTVAFAVYLAYNTFNAFNQVFIHSNLNLSYGWFGRYFMVSPANHRVHHSILPIHHNKNFSVTLVIWDRMFGTYHEGTDPLSQFCPVGYEGNIYNKNRWIVIEYLYPTFAFFTALYSASARRIRSFRSARQAKASV
jgi:sterol desaturase/sphingolipid hydroxylase (fatty acid hydroxylase superfamily)